MPPPRFQAAPAQHKAPPATPKEPVWQGAILAGGKVLPAVSSTADEVEVLEDDKDALAMEASEWNQSTGWNDQAHELCFVVLQNICTKKCEVVCISSLDDNAIAQGNGNPDYTNLSCDNNCLYAKAMKPWTPWKEKWQEPQRQWRRPAPPQQTEAKWCFLCKNKTFWGNKTPRCESEALACNISFVCARFCIVC